MDDLVAFLEARLAEDAAAAEGVTAGPWRYNPDKMWNLPGQHFGEEFIAAGPLDRPICVAATGDADDPQSMTDAAFIARHDPARTLREVAALRRVVEMYQSILPAPPSEEGDGFRLALEQVLTAFATVHHDHPQFLSHWAEGDPTDG
jgi:hypothetical protein